jgi:hypothetical protein
MASEPTISRTKSTWFTVLVAGGIWFLVYVIARLAVAQMGVEHPWAPVIACAPVPAFYWFVWVVQRALRGIDELQRRIHLEALALAFPTTMLVLMTLGIINLEIPLRNLWVMLPPLYGICLVIVNRRYR